MDEDPPQKGPLTRREFAARLLRAAAVMAVPAEARALAPAGAGAPATLLSNVMVPMRDGVQLATDIYRPARRSARRALAGHSRAHALRQDRGQPLRAHADGRSSPSHARRWPPSSCDSGYVVIYQDCRGRYGSRGRVRQIPERRRATATTPAPGSSASPGATARSAPWGCPMRRTRRVRSACAGAPGVAGDVSGLAAASPTPTRAASARAAPSNSSRSPGPISEATEQPAAQAGSGAACRDARRSTCSAWFARMPWKRGASPLSLPRPNTSTMCSTSGSTATSTPSGSSSASMPPASTTSFRDAADGAHVGLVRSRIRARRPTTTSACQSARSGRCG